MSNLNSKTYNLVNFRYGKKHEYPNTHTYSILDEETKL